MNAIHFIREYIRHPRSVGAVIPSSRQLAKQIATPIYFDKASCIIEYGAGTGVFTQELILNKRPETLLLVIEANESFYKTLQSKYGHLEKVHIIHGSAEHVARYMKQYHVSKVDYIVSGLPFTSLPAALSSLILGQTAEVLGQEGKFITFQYSKVKHNFFRTFFADIQIKKVNYNVPPAYVFTCSL
ncbi:rRNA adenine N-6-methyltransferase family protein [Paenibacillus sp. CMAA1739]|uniref:SAM-dependent methyltransferase n=1 Tax=Paenibacillus ottowii TaxID=2315729 RepID=A0ABY3B9F2_9BACL|nr:MULTISPECIES: rRNA adenine N-6-methyltransferase family protein [Paenibacillus]KZE70272.1 SAM-dependent methyltransferase [Paenibacillus jamilae]MDP1510189.1 rRNA adenine N-6-methyltransferase family protein [Paenibacillus ottowii]MEC4565605.1 rRNA adenine N-6-methyltransferase family protein [Paenibacillus sp. CMAA1739]NEU25628.1 SAM-dependent methyltransferase [Paenibacillus polymyxa]OBA01936.1 SAM-dependent methyltransferase [Paenibacillus polymyxa]